MTLSCGWKRGGMIERMEEDGDEDEYEVEVAASFWGEPSETR